MHNGNTRAPHRPLAIEKDGSSPVIVDDQGLRGSLRRTISVPGCPLGDVSLC
ncbi:MAG TPA: hypothetical protein VNJ02_18455 [Vicinamibacterales bacterium]|nr:hypothetical protein [Vicinamibacterales bacterium]